MQKVTQLFRRVAKKTLRLHFSNGEEIEVTPEHPFFVSSKGFRPAKPLAVGMAIATLREPVKVEAVQTLLQSKTVYNFGVD